MTFNEAKEILKTQTMPMTAEQLALYKEALHIVQHRAFSPEEIPE